MVCDGGQGKLLGGGDPGAVIQGREGNSRQWDYMQYRALNQMMHWGRRKLFCGPGV